MEKTIEEMRKNYEENLKPDEYHKHMMDLMNSFSDLVIPSFRSLHHLMKSGRFSGTKLLEIGSGPTVHNIASASAYFKEIVQSDYVESNCEELRKWLRGESNLDWSPYLEVVARVEGFEDLKTGTREIEERIRKRVKSVVRCDLLSERVIPEEVTTEYDLIVTVLTVEAVARDLEHYFTMLKRLSRLLRPGGGLVMIGFTTVTKWDTEGGEFHHLPVTRADIDQALDRAGFIEKEWEVIPNTRDRALFEFEEFFFVASRKA